jgi:hypothetical protein
MDPLALGRLAQFFCNPYLSLHYFNTLFLTVLYLITSFVLASFLLIVSVRAVAVAVVLFSEVAWKTQKITKRQKALLQGLETGGKNHTKSTKIL